jgi:hypothetical protein
MVQMSTTETIPLMLDADGVYRIIKVCCAQQMAVKHGSKPG